MSTGMRRDVGLYLVEQPLGDETVTFDITGLANQVDALYDAMQQRDAAYAERDLLEQERDAALLEVDRWKAEWRQAMEDNGGLITALAAADRSGGRSGQ